MIFEQSSEGGEGVGQVIISGRGLLRLGGEGLGIRCKNFGFYHKCDEKTLKGFSALFCFEARSDMISPKFFKYPSCCCFDSKSFWGEQS